MSKKSRNICIDIDGTMIDPYFFIPYLNELTGENVKEEEYTSIDWNDTYGPQYQNIYENFDVEYSHIYKEANILDGAKEVVDKLLKNGDQVYFVTARSKDIDEITKSWIEKQGLDSSRVYSLSGNSGKVKMAEKLQCDYFIEDDPNNVKNLLKAGYKVLLMDTNYNKEVLPELENELEKEKNIKKEDKSKMKTYNLESKLDYKKYTKEFMSVLENNLIRVNSWCEIKKILEIVI